MAPAAREKEVTTLWADTSLLPEGLERVCGVQTDAISLAPTAVGNITGYFLLPADSKEHQQARSPGTLPTARAGLPLLGQGSLTEERQSFEPNPYASSFSPTHFLSMELPLLLCPAPHPTLHCALHGLFGS